MDIGVVLVTFNRNECLKKAISKYENQIKKPKYIIVINNNSTDGTKEMLNEWIKINNSIDKYVINLRENIGGSGGFNLGLEKALDLKCDWIWLSDDDAYPEEDALSKVESFINSAKIKNISAICTKVINNNNIDTGHRRKINKKTFKISEEKISAEEYDKEYFELNLFSYVGCIINKNSLKSVGLPEKDYFIFYDDTEHSYRLNNTGKVICIPSIKVVHNVEVLNKKEISWKEYYGIRNKLLFYKKHFPKRYFIYEYFRYYIKMHKEKIINKNNIYKEVIYAAITDANKDIKGIHKIYKPGWKSNL